MLDTLEVYGRCFVPADQAPIPDWPSLVGEQLHPTLTLKDNDLFLITDTLGNSTGTLQDGRLAKMGLFCHDTRFLSRLELQIERHSPILLSSNAKKGFALSVLCANPRIDDCLKAQSIAIQREIVLSGGLFEAIAITNYNTTPVKFELSLSFDADFVDIFEIRGYQREQRGRLLHLVKPQLEYVQVGQEEPLTSDPVTPYPLPKELTLAYQALDGLLLESRIQFAHRQPDAFQGYTAVWSLELDAHATEHLSYRLQPLTDNRPTSAMDMPATLLQAKATELMEEEEWLTGTTRIRSDSKVFNQVIEQAEQDIYFLLQSWDNRKALSAGVPLFSTLFGRDSIIAASQTLIFDPAIAQQTLQILAHYQGKTHDEWRDEQPGKIMHEIRLGEMTRCQELPYTPYYGTVDATALWLMLYAEYYAWTHDQETLKQLWPNALAAMAWIDSNCKQTGYLSYYRQFRGGLLNQGWKDSRDCMVDREGKLANGAIALCEVQGYIYAAKMRLSEIALLQKEFQLAQQWQEDAQNLKTRFNRDFWLPDEDYCTLALDGEGQPVDSITSNPGQCLYLGIFTPEHAQSVAERLQAPDMFSGWGIRTLSSLSLAYNPMGYHTGSVWPHDNALIALGLRSHGYVEQALDVAQGIIDMTIGQPYRRPPELFCGYQRTEDSEPVRYPVACAPQAWASGSIFQLLQLMLNLVPNAANNELQIISPSLPTSINFLSLQNLKLGTTLLDLEFERSGTRTVCRVTKKRGNLRIVIDA